MNVRAKVTEYLEPCAFGHRSFSRCRGCNARSSATNELPKIIDRAEGVEVLNDLCWADSLAGAARQSDCVLETPSSERRLRLWDQLLDVTCTATTTETLWTSMPWSCSNGCNKWLIPVTYAASRRLRRYCQGHVRLCLSLYPTVRRSPKGKSLAGRGARQQKVGEDNDAAPWSRRACRWAAPSGAPSVDAMLR